MDSTIGMMYAVLKAYDEAVHTAAKNRALTCAWPKFEI